MSSTLETRKEERKAAKERAVARRALIAESIRQQRVIRDINDVRSDKVGAWNYELSADSDINRRCCPLCFQAYSDFELTAVVPCWHCRDKIPLAQAVAVAASVSTPEDDTAPVPRELDDRLMVEFLQKRIDNFVNTGIRLAEEARFIPDPGTKKKFVAEAKRYVRIHKDELKLLRKRVQLIESGREHLYYRDIALASRKHQAKMAATKTAQAKVHAENRLFDLHCAIKRKGKGVYVLEVDYFPPQIHCNKCGKAEALNISPTMAGMRPIGALVSSLKSRTQMRDFGRRHKKHAGVGLPIV